MGSAQLVCGLDLAGGPILAARLGTAGPHLTAQSGAEGSLALI